MSEQRAFEVVVLARAFGSERGREAVVEWFPPSVVALYDAVVADRAWGAATTLAERALVVAGVLTRHPELDEAYRADVEAGLLGFGADDDAETDAAIDAVLSELGGARMAEAAADAEAQPGEDDAPVPAAPPVAAEPAEDAAPVAAPPVDDAPVAPPPVAPPPSDDAADAEVETISSWLNADLDRDERELAVDRAAQLTVSFGERSAGAVAAVRAHLAVPRGQEVVELTVDLASTDFAIETTSHPLRLHRDGRSEAPAVFTITPLHPGISRLSVVVSVGGNFVQRLDISFDIGGDAVRTVRALGRPAASAEVLGPRIASLQISSVGGRYELLAIESSPQPLRLAATPLDLAPRIEAVRAALLRAVKDDAVSLAMTIPRAHSDALLADLAFAGYRLYQAIFEDGASPELRAAGDWLRSLAGRADVTTLQIVSEGFPVPWPLLYLVDEFDPDALDWGRFLGMQCVVEQIPLAPIAAAPPSTVMESRPRLGVRTLLNETIDAEMPSQPITAQRAYWAGHDVALTEGTTRADLIGALRSDTADQVLYLFCHAETDDDDSDASEIIMTGKDAVTLGELKALAPERRPLTGHPLVFFNACESGELSPLFYSGFVPYFLNKGARGVIGTECRTPGLFASEWAKAFFDGLLAGRALGEVVLGLRRRFLAEHNNPLGLLYVVHCDADTIVSPALT